MSGTWVQLLLFLFGIVIIFIAFFKPKEQRFIEDRVEKIIDEFTYQFSLENDELIKKIKESQQQFSVSVENKINHIEERLIRLERQQKPTPQINPKYQEVMRLYQNGEDVHQIARKTNMGHGEVELVIELMKKGFSYV